MCVCYNSVVYDCYSSVEKLRTMVEDLTEFLDAIWDVYCSEGKKLCFHIICMLAPCHSSSQTEGGGQGEGSGGSGGRSY